MTTIKSYTDLEQSKKLAEILPPESADMWWLYVTAQGKRIAMMYEEPDPHYLARMEGYGIKDAAVRCWSLAALLEQIPYEICDDDGNSSYLQMDKENDVYQLIYTDPYGDFESIETDRYEHFVDACYELIMKLHELNLL